MLIRKMEREDAGPFLQMLRQLDSEQKFMMYEPGERKTTADEMRAHIENMNKSGSLILAAEADGTIAGFLSAERGFAQRIKHSAYIVVGVLKAYSNAGAGTRLFEELEKWALGSGITRLELSVMCHNEKAIKLYKKAGYEIEGVKVKSLLIDGLYIDEYYMAKLI